jgi:transcriptional regulator with XRE-family HTH domain
MEPYPEEDRIAGLLRELLAQSGVSTADLEQRLGWQTGRLTAFIEGSQRLSFDDVSEILLLLGMTPTDFFARLYGSVPPAAYSPAKQRAMERLFERSLRAVRSAIARRAAWKRERNDES